jgi:hypothetical protein
MNALSTIALFATALCLGGMVFFTVVIAPIVFRVLDADAGGRFIRALFPVFYLYVLATSAVAAASLAPLSLTAAALMAAIALCTIWLRQWLMPRINAASDARRAGDTAAAARFDRGHRLSVIANIAQMAAAMAVLAGF